MASTRHFLLLLSLLLFVNQITVESNFVSIKTPNDLIKFSNEVNDGNRIFQGFVMLENDLDMTGLSPIFNPIGFKGGSKTFQGAFDGKGHTISNLNVTYDRNQFVGLFGYSFGMSLRNLILDNSCLITSNRVVQNYPTFLGGFMSYCISKNHNCVLENLVNMAALSARGYNYVGGIAGSIKSDSRWFPCHVVNCLNFGTTRVYDIVKGGVLGGIVGIVISERKSILVQNCANYGNTIYPSYFKPAYGAGGIVGDITDNSIIQNCINMGDFIGDEGSPIGSIVGTNEANSGVEIENCYWLKGTYGNKIVGSDKGKMTGNYVKESTSFLKDFRLSKQIDANGKRMTKVVDALNSFPEREFEKWVLLDLNGGEVVKMDNYLPRVPFFSKQIDLFRPRKEGYRFGGWHLDLGLKSIFNPKTDYSFETETLYAKWVVPITVTFTFGTEKNTKNVMSDEAIEYPDVEVARGYKGEWCTQEKKMCNPVTSEKDIELHLIQTPKEYTLSFNTSGGKQIEPKTVVFDEPIGKLPVPAKEGCEFLGWFADPELKYPFYTKRMPYNDICLHAKWKYVAHTDTKGAPVNTLNCLNVSEFEKWVILGLDEKEIKNKNKKYPSKPPILGNRKALNNLKEDCVFRGWYLDPEFRTAFNPEIDDISDVAALYGKWVSPIKITFIFDSRKIEEKIISGDIIEYPSINVARGHKGEWCTQEKAICNPVTSDKDIELYLVQTPKEYTLSFNTSGGEQIESRTVVFDELIGELPVPVKEGYSFLGWFADPELKYSFYTERMPDNDMCIHAKWKGASKEENAFARFTTFACIVLSVVATCVVFGKRSIIGLKL